MQTWTHGYVSDISYDYSFFPELSPTSMAFNLLNSRYVPPSLEQFTYCELGCGQGFTTNILAATHPQGEFWGIDFNPTHTAEAQRLAQAAQLSNMQFFDHSFAEFLAADTPPFDFITLHGVYSWIDDKNRHHIVNLLQQKLKVGGAVYISYNALPGWAALMPLQMLMQQSSSQSGDSSLHKIEAGMAFAQQLQGVKARYFLDNPSVKADLEAMTDDSRHYLAHEYLNQNWQPFYHSEVVQQLAEAKLTYATSGDIDDQFYDFKLTEAQLSLLAEIPDLVRRETIRDFLFNTRFRRDLFVKGAVRLGALEQVEQLSQVYFALIINPEEMAYEVDLVGRSIKLEQAIYEPIVAAFATQPRSLRELMRHPDLKQLDFVTICQALKILISTYQVTPALPPAEAARRRTATTALNQAILRRSRFGADTQVLASPVTASGIDVSRSEQLFLLAHLRQADPVAFVWSLLQVQGEKLIKDGEVLATAAANQAELAAQAQQFQQQRLPLFQQLGILES
ncbi:MAG: methyltransferase regulatory domain-containing protein [Leptolyngbyaceae cyanobacterium]